MIERGKKDRKREKKKDKEREIEREIEIFGGKFEIADRFARNICPQIANVGKVCCA